MWYHVGDWFYWYEGRLRHVSGDFSLVATTLNAWLVINEVGKGRDKWSNVFLVVFLFSLSASVVGLVRAGVLMG